MFILLHHDISVATVAAITGKTCHNLQVTIGAASRDFVRGRLGILYAGVSHGLGSDPGMAVQSRHEEIRYIFSAERHMSWHESDIVLNVHERGKDFID